MEFIMGNEVRRGKTKTLYASNQEGVVIVKNRDNITAHDNPDHTRQLPGKGAWATTTTCNVFELYRTAGVPVAYIERISDARFAARHVTMLPIESVVRYFWMGSGLDRYPHIPKTNPPQRTNGLVHEMFLKTSDGSVRTFFGDDIFLDLQASQGEEDPLMVPIEGGSKVDLYHAHRPIEGAKRIATISSRTVFGDRYAEYFDEIEKLSKWAFRILAGAFKNLGWRLVDIKFEFGIGKQGQVFLADVVDNDSWRLRTEDWKEVSKQAYRAKMKAGDEDLSSVAANYELVAEMSKRLRIPRQAIVIWQGSDTDTPAVAEQLAKMIEVPPCIDRVQVIMSGHRLTRSVLAQLRQVETDYPEGAVIIAAVGLSNGLGPILSAHTHLPVINLPLTPEDIGSSTRLPGGVPASTVLRISNAVQQALQILAISNPVAYATVSELAEADTGELLPDSVRMGWPRPQ